MFFNDVTPVSQTYSQIYILILDYSQFISKTKPYDSDHTNFGTWDSS